jgi:glycosyltransferase involved in cell wall biosynthesis
VVHAQFLRENYIALLAKLMGLRAKVLWTYHVNTPVPLTLYVTNRIFTQWNDQVIAVSHFIKKQLTKKGVPEGKIRVIHNGLHKKAACGFKEPSSPFVIASIGRLSEEKGHIFLLKALKELKNLTQGQIPWTCLVAGDGPLKDKIIEKKDEYDLTDDIQMLGFIEDVDRIYQESDVIAISSKNDALPYTAIESISWGKAVVGTNIGGIPEVIEDGYNGIIVPYGDEKGYARALYRLMTDYELLRQMGENGKKKFETSFTFSQMYQQLITIYNQ